mgnify:CR=1 FL=1
MEYDKKQARIMSEMRDAILAAIGECASRHEGRKENATFMGAISWVLADFMIAADIQPDAAFLDRLDRTIAMARTLHDRDANDSVH